ncbi:MAG: CPBP family intramembrane metalloprotease [Clostridia bacterium]|nr:CPBP family intramembrane metalloprotease [Clostridia bacterium]
MGEFFNHHEPDLTPAEFKKPSITQVSILFSLSLIVFLVIGHRIPIENFYIKTSLAEVVLVMLPPIFFLGIFKYDIKKNLRLHNPGILNLFLTVLIMGFSLPVVNFLNLLNLLLLKFIFGKITIPDIPTAQDPAGLLIGVLVIGLSAGVCEEILFRGTIQRGFERFGPVIAILVTAFLFGLMHLDFQRLLGTFLLGGLIGFLVYRSNSLFTGMLAHFTNNSIAVVLSYLFNKLLEYFKSRGVKMPENAGSKDVNQLLSDITIIEITGSLLFAFFCAAIVAALIFAFISNTKNKAEKGPRSITVQSSKGLIWLLPGLIVVSIIYIAEGLKLSGHENQIISQIVRFFIGG